MSDLATTSYAGAAHDEQRHLTMMRMRYPSGTAHTHPPMHMHATPAPEPALSEPRCWSQWQAVHLAGWQPSTASARASDGCAAVSSHPLDDGLAPVSVSRGAPSNTTVADPERSQQLAAPSDRQRTQHAGRGWQSNGLLDLTCCPPGGRLHAHQIWWADNDAGLGGTAPRRLHSQSADAGVRGSTDGEACRRRQHCGNSTAISPAARRRRPRQVSSGTDFVVTSPCSYGAVQDSLTNMRQASRHMHSQSGKDEANAGPSVAATPAQPATWLDRYCPQSLLPFAQLIRLDKPIGEATPELLASHRTHWATFARQAATHEITGPRWVIKPSSLLFAAARMSRHRHARQCLRQHHNRPE